MPEPCPSQRKRPPLFRIPLALGLFILLGLAACAVAEVPGFSPPEDMPLLEATPAAEVTPAAEATVALQPEPTADLAPTAAPTMPASPTPQVCRETAGSFERYGLLSPYLKGELNYRVYYPPCYDDSGETRYPVLYMLHGQTYNDDQWARLGIGEAADALINTGEVPPFLIVLPYEVDTFADPYADGYGPALVETLIPWVDAFYPTCPAQACRAIGGLSRGGAWAYLLALDNPGLFGAAGGHSMVPFGGMQVRLPNQLRSTPADQFPRLWMDMGKSDIYLPDLKVYEELLTQQAVPHEYTLQDGYHDEAYWSAHLADYLRWYAAGFPAGESQ